MADTSLAGASEECDRASRPRWLRRGQDPAPTAILVAAASFTNSRRVRLALQCILETIIFLNCKMPGCRAWPEHDSCIVRWELGVSLRLVGLLMGQINVLRRDRRKPGRLGWGLDWPVGSAFADFPLGAQPMITRPTLGSAFFLVKTICKGCNLGFLIDIRPFCRA